ncbi:zinc finger protein 664 isoform X3 [Pipistrellus kuhlii]|uniref:zinc finger protein 664 isoform X3 n=1 Tax=Pipistrellus kuhlii TaxID=59472 RepID=UPI001E26F45F|nr:zinc finger protein 664 isoform X3 [Pipistrellus kuhlii]
MRAARLPRARRPVRAHARWPRRRRDVRRAARSAPVRRPRRSGGGAAGASAPHSEARRPRSPASTGAGDEEPAARSAAAAGRLHCLSAAWPLPQELEWCPGRVLSGGAAPLGPRNCLWETPVDVQEANATLTFPGEPAGGPDPLGALSLCGGGRCAPPSA